MKKINSLFELKIRSKPFSFSKKLLLSVVALLFCSLVSYGQTEPFITIWKTDNSGDSNDTSIKIPASGTFDYTWEEVGNASNSGSGSGTDVTTIDFGTPGTYQVSMTPSGSDSFHRIAFNDEGDKEKILDITQWGDIEWSSFEEAYHGAENLEITATDTPNLSNVSSMSWAFVFTDFSTASEMNNWNTENVTDMSFMFYAASSFNQDIGGWDVSNVTDMREMFFEAFSFNQDIGGWDLNSLGLNIEDYSAEGMFNNSGIDCENYSATLLGWANNPNTASDVTLGADGMQYSPDVEEYRNILINDLGWTIEGDTEGSCTLSVNSEKEVVFELYPNPTNDFVFISGLEGEESISLFDISGKLLHSFTTDNTEVSIDMTEFASGVYFLNIKTKDHIQTTKKIIKQ